VSAAVFWGIGTAFSELQYAGPKPGANNLVEAVFKRANSGNAVAKIAAHAAAGGTLTELQGGKFGHGFVAAGFTQALSPAVGQIGDDDGFGATLARTAVSAAIGGTASTLSGGSFANGAKTGAFQQLFNDSVHLESYADNYMSQSREVQLQNATFAAEVLVPGAGAYACLVGGCSYGAMALAVITDVPIFKWLKFGRIASPKVKMMYHYTSAAEDRFSTGLWPNSSVTNELIMSPYAASQRLGIPLPNKIIPIQSGSHFIPNRPPIVEQSPRYFGGGTDFINPARVDSSFIRPAIPLKSGN